jgi:hypothetical protein
MPTIVNSPINRRSDDLPLSPGAQSSPSRGQEDSVPGQQPGGTASGVPASHGAEPDPSLKADGGLTPAQGHLLRHVMLRAPK